MENCRCLSYNVCNGGKLCELNSENKENNISLYEQSDECDYYEYEFKKWVSNNSDCLHVHSPVCLSVTEALVRSVHSNSTCYVGLKNDRMQLKYIQSIALLKRARPFVPRHTLIKMYNAFVLPHFNYCSTIWNDGSCTIINKLSKLQRRAARVIDTSRICLSAHKTIA